MKLRKVYPKSRISTDHGFPDSEIRLLKPKYYRCPHCGKRTLIKSREVSPFATAKTTPDFDKKTLTAFENMGRNTSKRGALDSQMDAYDFECTGCHRPVRLLYQEYERAMGSELSPVIYEIVERAD